MTDDSKKEKVIIALSGGVDSSVAAYLLKKKGFNVIALFMKIWHQNNSQKDCPWKEDSSYAMEVAEKLNIPFHIVDLSKEYKNRIVNYMFEEYSLGRTPNPDILCNKEIKFDVFLKYALQLKANYIATGHYCIKRKENDNYKLIAGKDKNKDQSYFLCQLNQQQLSKILFPIGKMKKEDVRKLAKKINLPTATRKDSQGLCFIGKIKLPEFLSSKLPKKKGKIIEIPFDSKIYKKEKTEITEKSKKIIYKEDDGQIIGNHNGAHFFTIGQRKRLNIGGKEKPLFVISTDVQKNIVFVGMGEKHPGLYQKYLRMKKSKINWIRDDLKLDDNERKEFLIRTRYRQKLTKGTIISKKDNLYIKFQKPQKSITPGQFASWYLKDELIGSGVIEN